MKRTAVLILAWSCLIACGVDRKDQAIDAQPAKGAPSTAEPLLQGAALSGREIYAEFCAACHDSGTNGAPVTGNRDEWQNRSPLWQAVLIEHAKAGYLGMPAKGGSDELSELSVSHAVEYMLLTTFPDRLPD